MEIKSSLNKNFYLNKKNKKNFYVNKKNKLQWYEMGCKHQSLMFNLSHHTNLGLIEHSMVFIYGGGLL